LVVLDEWLLVLHGDAVIRNLVDDKAGLVRGGNQITVTHAVSCDEFLCLGGLGNADG
jgi:hypothetical protein